MRQKYLLLFSLAAALLLPRAVEAQSCTYGYCETFALYDAGSNLITGYSTYESWDGPAMVESYIWDPNTNYTYLGSAQSSGEAEFDFSYTPEISGIYTVAGFNSYLLEGNNDWAPDGDSSSTVYGGPPPPYISGCQLQGPSWQVGSNTIVCSGQFLTGTASVTAGGPYGNGFLTNSNVTVISDTEIVATVTLTDILYNGGWIDISDGTASDMVELPEISAPPASFAVQYQAYIPVDHVTGPRPCFYNVNLVQLIYKGDGTSGTYRAAEGITLVPVGGFSLTPWADTGQTRNYGFGSPANRVALSGFDEDGTANDCYLWNAADTATHPWIPTVTYPTGSTAVASLSGTASNPLEPQVGGIKWSIFVGVDASDPNASTATVNYEHTCYPAHQITVNGQVVYSYVPQDNSPFYVATCLLGGLATGVGPAQTVPVTVPSHQ